MIDNKVLKSIKAIIKTIIRIHPKGEDYARHILFEIWRLKVRLISCSRKIDVERTCWISPQKIVYACEGIDYRKPGYNKYGDRGKIKGGIWDLKRVKFSDLPVYNAFIEHFIEKKDWEHTEFHSQILDEIARGETPWGCKNKSEVNERMKKIDQLYVSIKKNGYRSQKELLLSELSHIPTFKSVDEIAVRIGRDGEILFEDGRHRLTISKLLNLSNIPVIITVRHSDWYRFRNEILNYAREHNNQVYHPITHVDLSDIPYAHGGKRFEIIKPHLPKLKGDLLDIGAHWGYFCHKFEDEGFNCYAVEDDQTNLYFLKKLKKAENRKFKVIGNSILKYDISNMKFTVVLALNIFCHFLKYKETYYDLIKVLRNLKMEIMFFQPHLPDDPQMAGAYKKYSCDEVVKFVLMHSNLNHSRLIGKAEDKRPIYMMYR